MSLTYQLAAYDWSDFNWENRQVSKHTGARINHVTLRTGGQELFINSQGTQWVPSNVIERRFNAPLHVTGPRRLPGRAMVDIGKIKDLYGPINRPYLYLYHYTFRLLPVPRSCTDLTWCCLNAIGLDVKERFYPHTLIKEFYRCK